MPKVREFEGQRVLICGGGRGIGLKIAEDLATEGAQLWITARTKESVNRLARFGPLAQSSILDVSHEDEVRRLFDKLAKNWNGVDAVIVTAAELGQTGPFWTLSSSQMVQTLSVNLIGALHVLQALVAITPIDVRLKRRVILFAGGGAAYGYPNFLPYATSKVALVRMCETVARELEDAQIPILVNIIAPGANETDMLSAVRAAGGEVRTTVAFTKPIDLCKWLLSEAASNVSGRFIHVNDERNTIPLGSGGDRLRLRRQET